MVDECKEQEIRTPLDTDPSQLQIESTVKKSPNSNLDATIVVDSMNGTLSNWSVPPKAKPR